MRLKIIGLQSVRVNAARVVLDIKLENGAQKVVTVKSALVLRNKTDTRLEVKLELSQGMAIFTYSVCYSLSVSKWPYRLSWWYIEVLNSLDFMQSVCFFVHNAASRMTDFLNVLFSRWSHVTASFSPVRYRHTSATRSVSSLHSSPWEKHSLLELTFTLEGRAGSFWRRGLFHRVSCYHWQRGGKLQVSFGVQLNVNMILLY